MKPFRTASRQSQQAFSMTEILVGMTIGLLGMIIIMQMTSLFETRRRITTSGDNSLDGGAIALYALNAQVGQAGYGISSPLLVGQSLATTYITMNPLLPAIVNPAQLAAVQTAGTDSFIVVYGNSNANVEGALIGNSVAGLPYQITGGTGQSGTGEGGKSFAINDWVVPVQSGVTGALSTYQVIGPVSTSVVAVSGIPPLLTYGANQVNPPLLFNLGSSPSIKAYAIINQALSVCDYAIQNCAAPNATWTSLSEGVINMRAQCEGASTLRIAVVSRGIQVESTSGVIATNTTPTWNPGGVSAPVVANPVPSWGANWNLYRYKTFETVVPVHNAIWAGVRGC